MPSDSNPIQRFMQGREAASEAEKRRLERAGTSPRWSVAVALSLIDAVERAGTVAGGTDEVVERQRAELQSIWRRLRERM